MKAVAYIRVSSQGQADGDGPDRQRERIKEFCSKNGLEFHCEFFEFISGTVDGMEREGFLDAVDEVEKIKGCLVVEKLDRLARTVIVQEVAIRELNRRQVVLYSADQPGLIDVASSAEDPGRVMMRQIFAAVAQFERSMIVYRTKHAKKKIIEQFGKCGGNPFYGESDAAEKRILGIMKEMRADGASYGKIADELNLFGLAPRRSARWNRTQVFSILSGKDRRLKI
jgi:DNA invertase Pin-like site-specific DNA recombinase